MPLEEKKNVSYFALFIRVLLVYYFSFYSKYFEVVAITMRRTYLRKSEKFSHDAKINHEITLHSIFPIDALLTEISCVVLNRNLCPLGRPQKSDLTYNMD